MDKGEQRSVSIIPEQYFDLLQSTTVITVATIGPRGEPQNNPVWFGWDGSHVLFSLTHLRAALPILHHLSQKEF